MKLSGRPRGLTSAVLGLEHDCGLSRFIFRRSKSQKMKHPFNTVRRNLKWLLVAYVNQLIIVKLCIFLLLPLILSFEN